jgi:hypothetical protein
MHGTSLGVYTNDFCYLKDDDREADTHIALSGRNLVRAQYYRVPKKARRSPEEDFAFLPAEGGLGKKWQRKFCRYRFLAAVRVV